jgi:hypothetical protein
MGNIWQFKDKYKNILGVIFKPSSKYFETFFVCENNYGKFIKIYDYEKQKNLIKPGSFIIGSDEHRSDTWAKILRDEIIPEHLINNKESVIKIHTLDDYRYKIFLIAAKNCKSFYPEIEIKQSGKEIWLINK